MKNSTIFAFFIGILVLMSFEADAASKSRPDRQSYKIYVDKKGVMRRSDTKEEVSYYGTNYTLPFAHAYRAVGNLGVDRKDAIDRDVYHLKRLGFNGFRLHLWDVEISDSLGNLLENDHLDLLDYLISRLEEEGIDIILTAQTNFGNGYPEKNIDTGAFTYDFEKCEIHENKEAQKIQSNYLTQLVSHVNPYTGRSYSDDNAIIAIEVNNEPCHSGTKKEVTEYINKMVKALKKGGFDKPVLYNVSHNPEVTEAYYEADIQGTTYQWYPTGLVAGHQRKGNFLPYVDEYPIPWKDTMKNYDKLARVVYEFDPGDVLYSYLYPAIARTFRKEGFQWITQFAYDPIDIAKYNTEYQTHFLNLAYTPSKAISMLIAGEAARNIPRGTDYGKFPVDTVFGDFLVSSRQDLSLYNSPEKFYYSNDTDIKPKDLGSLRQIAGTGSSPIIEYSGTGAYFVDEVSPGLWRLEVMPDVMITSDPFEKPSLKKEIARIFYSERPMKIALPQLGENFYFEAVNNDNDRAGQAKKGQINVYPGVYLLSRDKELISSTLAKDDVFVSTLRRYVASEADNTHAIVAHNPAKYIENGGNLEISAEIIGNTEPDSVFIYPDYVSFWNDNNNIIPMNKVGDNIYKAFLTPEDLGRGDRFRYNVVVKENGSYHTWPQNLEGTPLDWDFTEYKYYTSQKINPEDAVILLAPSEDDPLIDIAMVPEAWNFRLNPSLTSPAGNNVYNLTARGNSDGKLIVRRYVGDELTGVPYLNNKKYIVVKLWPHIFSEGISVGLTGKNGATYSAFLNPSYGNEMPVKLHDNEKSPILYRIPLADLVQTPTNILPAVYPSFLPRESKMDSLPFNLEETDFVELIFPVTKSLPLEPVIEGIWLE